MARLTEPQLRRAVRRQYRTILEQAEAEAEAFESIQRGSKGPKVKEIQAKLGVTADGDFGPNTEKALEAAHGVKVVDKATYNKIMGIEEKPEGPTKEHERLARAIRKASPGRGWSDEEETKVHWVGNVGEIESIIFDAIAKGPEEINNLAHAFYQNRKAMGKTEGFKLYLGAYLMYLGDKYRDATNADTRSLPMLGRRVASAVPPSIGPYHTGAYEKWKASADAKKAASGREEEFEKEKEEMGKESEKKALKSSIERKAAAASRKIYDYIDGLGTSDTELEALMEEWLDLSKEHGDIAGAGSAMDILADVFKDTYGESLRSWLLGDISTDDRPYKDYKKGRDVA
jgi:hypothetical protein